MTTVVIEERNRSHGFHMEIVREVVRAIEFGDYKPGDRLPTNRELAVKASLNVTHADQAIRVLEQNGIASRLGSRVYIRASANDIQAARIRDRLEGVQQAARVAKGVGASQAEVVGAALRDW